MSEPFLAEIMIVGFNFAPRGWALCDGQILPINQNQSLYSLLGTTYGGDGRTSFALPDTRGRSVIGVGTGPGLSTIQLGQKSGVENRTLSTSNMPSHNHAATTTVAATATAHANSIGNIDAPAGNVWASLDREDTYSSATPNVTMNAAAITVAATATTTTGNAGSGTSFSIRDPYIAMHWLIQISGLYPSRN